VKREAGDKEAESEGESSRDTSQEAERVRTTKEAPRFCVILSRQSTKIADHREI
jgi:hypothetical protein